jgi:hypothetical protein
VGVGQDLVLAQDLKGIGPGLPIQRHADDHRFFLFAGTGFEEGKFAWQGSFGVAIP